MQIRSPGFFQAADCWLSDWENINTFIDSLQADRVWEIGPLRG